jgi:hypothetical protein
MDMKQLHIIIYFLLLALCVSCEQDKEFAKTEANIINENIIPSYTSAQISCMISTDATVDQLFLQYSTQEDYSNYQEVEMIFSDGVYNTKLDDLLSNTLYYIRYLAKNSYSMLLIGEKHSFSTLEIMLPTVETVSVTDIMTNNATVSGNVLSYGDGNIGECGVVYSASQNPTLEDSVVVYGETIGEFTCSLTGLQPGITYYVRAYATGKKGTAYGEELSFTTETHAYVDLGLSVKWATCNIGASSPEEYGDYFAWGETEPKDVYDWSTYKWCNGSQNTLTKYCTKREYGVVDNKTALELEDDAAHVNWGGEWRMPTKAELEELRTKCTWLPAKINGVSGREITGPNGNTLFLPYSGYCSEGKYPGGGTGHSWSSTSSAYNAYKLVYSWNGYYVFDDLRCFGFTIRAVHP